VFGQNHSFSELVNQKKVIFSSHLSNNDAKFELLPKPTCFQDFIQVGTFEVTFLSRFAASTWHRDVFARYSDIVKYPLSKCPNTVRVVHLLRTEGTSIREMRNFNVIDAIIRKYGWTYENVSINSTSSDTTVLEAFSNFSLMITSHSSQLKNLVFARKGAVVVELRPGANEFRNPFGEGLEHTDVIYKLSFILTDIYNDPTLSCKQRLSKMAC
jgi:hypothetical protein